METMIEAKFDNLKAYLIETEAATEEELENETAASTYNSGCETFEIIGNTYRVLTEEEADKAATESIKNDLWAFNPDFVLKHTEFYTTSSDREDEEFCKALSSLQGSICEGATPIFKALIADLDEFARDAIEADGRGHFISFYDGEEYEAGMFYIYRID